MKSFMACLADQVYGQDKVTFRNIGWGNNEIWEITHAGGIDFLKQYNHGREGFLREKWALENLRDVIPVPEIRFASDSAVDRPVLITIGVPGTPLDKVETNRDSLVQQLGELVGVLHAATDLLSAPSSLFGPVLPYGTIDELLESVKDAEVEAAVSAERFGHVCDVIGKPRRPVFAQRDCGDWQCLVNENRIAAIVDWESAGMADPEVDLAFAAAFLRAFRDPAEEVALLRGYRARVAHRLDMDLYENLIQADLLSLYAMWRSRGRQMEAQKARSAFLASTCRS